MTDYEKIVRDNIDRGAKLLDVEYPEWFTYDFDWDGLNLSNADMCIIGQLSNSSGARWRSYIDAIDGALPLADGPTRYGFVAETMNDREYHIAKQFHNDVWREEVERRLGNVIVREVAPAGAVVLNPTEKKLLEELLAVRVLELEDEQNKLKPQYREFLNPPLMTARALLVEVRKA
jgi:hypothetical protein